MRREIDQYDAPKIRLRNKAIQLIEVLNHDKIDYDEVCKLSFSGIPDGVRGLRPIVWRVILGSFPLESAEW